TVASNNHQRAPGTSSLIFRGQIITLRVGEGESGDGASGRRGGLRSPVFHLPVPHSPTRLPRNRWNKPRASGYHQSMTEGSPSETGPHEEVETNIGDALVTPARVARRAAWAELAFLLFLCAYSVLAVLAHRYAYFDWDLELERYIQSISVPGFASVMIFV